MARVLVIEDEADLRAVLEYNLAKEGHEVRHAASGQDGLRLARAHRPDLVLLDVMLPDTSGIAICAALKADDRTRATRVIMVTARGEEQDRLVGFELGIDDYVVKPFSVKELMMRVAAVLRRGSEAEPQERVQEFGALRIDRAAHRVWVGGAEIALTTLEFRLLVTLFERRNRVQTRTGLLSDVWGIDAEITTRTIDTHVKRLREKLGPAGPYVETVRGVGYRFTESPAPEPG